VDERSRAIHSSLLPSHKRVEKDAYTRGIYIGYLGTNCYTAVCSSDVGDCGVVKAQGHHPHHKAVRFGIPKMLRRLIFPASVATAGAVTAAAWSQRRSPLLQESPPSATTSSEPGTANKPVTTKSWTYYSGLPVSNKEQFKLFTGNSNPELAKEVAKYLDVELGKVEVSRFTDGEVNIQILDNVRGKDVFVLQSTSSPVNDNYMELLLMVSCLRRSSAKRITVIAPYVGYARASVLQDKAVPISARAIAIMLETMGVDRVVGVDLHAGQIQGFFNPTVPTDNLESGKVGANYFADAFNLQTPTVVAIRTYSVARAKDFREALASRGRKTGNESLAGTRLGMVIRNDDATEPSLDTVREGEGEQEEQSVGIELVGMDKIDGDVILLDDIIDTSRTLCAAAKAVKARGARKIYAFATHGLFTEGALERIKASPIDCVVVTNTVASIPDEMKKSGDKIVRLSLAPLLAETIRRIYERESLGETVFRMAPIFDKVPKEKADAATASPSPSAPTPQ